MWVYILKHLFIPTPSNCYLPSRWLLAKTMSMIRKRINWVIFDEIFPFQEIVHIIALIIWEKGKEGSGGKCKQFKI